MYLHHVCNTLHKYNDKSSLAYIVIIIVYSINLSVSTCVFITTMIDYIFIVKIEKEGEPPSSEDSPSLSFIKYF